MRCDNPSCWCNEKTLPKVGETWRNTANSPIEVLKIDGNSVIYYWVQSKNPYSMSIEDFLRYFTKQNKKMKVRIVLAKIGKSGPIQGFVYTDSSSYYNNPAEGFDKMWTIVSSTIQEVEVDE